MKLKLCITFVLLFIAALCLGLIVLLIPMVVLPSLNEELVEYDSTPVICSLHEIRIIKSWKKCRASHSCRDDCDTVPRRCVRIYVDFREPNRESKDEATLNQSTVLWSAVYVPLLVNPRACGDPSGMSCTVFENLYTVGDEFPCHRSMQLPTHAVLELWWGEDEPFPLTLTLGLPLSLTLIFLSICCILCFWYCRGSPGYRKDEDLDIETERKYAFE